MALIRNVITTSGLIQRALWLLAMLIALSADPVLAQERQSTMHRIGVLLHGGHYYVAIEGLRDGLRQLGFEEGKHYVLDIRAARGNLKVVERAARDFAREKVDLIYSLAGSVSKAVKKGLGDSDIPVVFAAGSDPQLLGLVESHAKPGGNFTGIHFQLTNLTPKRLEILKEILPKAQRVLTLYNPANKGSQKAIQLARDVAERLRIELVERHVASPEEIRLSLQALKAGEVDAYFFTSNAMVGSNADLIIDRARSLRLPTVFHEPTLIDQGALATYGLSFHAVGMLAAKYVYRVVNGAYPGTLPVESLSRIELAINLKVANELGLTIPPEVLYQATRIIR